MGMESKNVVLALDKIYRAHDRKTVGDAMVALSPKQGEKPVWLALDITYVLDENGKPTSEVEHFQPVDLDTLCKLPVRDYDLSINTPRGPVRVPGVIVSQTFSDTVFREVKFNNQNVFKRDKYICQFENCKFCENKTLTGDKLNLDHVQPRSRGGANDWENVITSCIKANSIKDDRTLAELGWKLKRKPFKPSPELMNGLSPELIEHMDWRLFLK